jgi:sugar phosphate isomerase/epimerase
MTHQDVLPGRPKLGVTLYSFTNAFHDRLFDFEGLLREVARLRVGPWIEIVGYQSIRGFPAVSDTFAGRFKDVMAELGLQASCLAINADACLKPGVFVSEDTLVESHERQLQAARTLGFPVVRFQYGAGTKVIERVLPTAERLGIKMGMEVHAPDHVRSPTVMAFRELYARLGSPLLGFVPDFGASARRIAASMLQEMLDQGVPQQAVDLAERCSQAGGSANERRGRFVEEAGAQGFGREVIGKLGFLFNIYGNQRPEDWMEIMPQIVHVHGKFYDADARGEDNAIDHRRVLRVLVQGGYSGTISLEWEGHIFSDAPGFAEVVAHRRYLDGVLAELTAEPVG